MKMNDFRSSIALGKLYEDRFREAAIERGFTVSLANENQQKFGKIDFFLTKDGETKTVDVKAPKSLKRGKPTNFERIWVEFQNPEGYLGTLYSDSCDFYAFSVRNGFVIIDKKDLVVFCEKNVKDIKVTDPRDSLYKKYTRRFRNDIISTVLLDDIIKNCRHSKWKCQWKAI